MSQATTLSSMMQQLFLSLGVAVGAYALTAAALVSGAEPTDVSSFRIAFFVVGAISATSILMLLRLPQNAGQELSGRKAAESEIRPQTT